MLYRLKKRRLGKLLRENVNGKRKRPESSEEERSWGRTTSQRKRKRRRRERVKEKGKERKKLPPLRPLRSQRDLAPY